MRVIKRLKAAKRIIVEVPAGSYYLGDPCSALGDASWKQVGKTSNYFYNAPVATINGQRVLGFHTEHGDGLYFDNFGHSFDVDTGLIGLVPEGLIDKHSAYRRMPRIGTIVKFDEPTVCSTDRGVMAFGRYQIDTRW